MPLRRWDNTIGRRVAAGGRHARRGWVRLALLLIVAVLAAGWWLAARTVTHPVTCVVVGLDGLDPVLCRQFMDRQLLPNLKQLAEEGSFTPLATSNPPQSPVAWSCFATGLNPGGTGLFDFVHRNRETYLPVEAMSQVVAAEPFVLPLSGRKLDPWLDVGRYRIPLRAQTPTINRKGTPFWKLLEAAGVPATVLRLPANYPPTPGSTRQLSGMGTPDLTGSTGSYFYWTQRELSEADRENLRGRANLETVDIRDGRIETRVVGPPNALAREEAERHAALEVPLTISIDPKRASARLRLGEEEAVLRPGDWSPWMSVQFTLAPWWPANPKGIMRFWLKSLSPFELYATPINVDPSDAALPITNPRGYAAELSSHLGRFTTLGMPEDDKAMGSRVRALTEESFRAQCRQVLEDVWRTTEFELARFRGGMLFTYFRTPDVMCHMMWYTMDSKHPAYDAEAARLHDVAIEECYRWVDEKVGQIRARVDRQALFIVLSDHGFAPFYRQVDLNSWLADNGWTAFDPWADREDPSAFPDYCNWSQTRAYGVGLNGLYLNVRGREANGIIPPEDREKVAEELCRALEQIVDPETGQRVISRAYRREEIYSGPYVDEAPDIIVGYNRGYRVNWRSALAQFPPAREIEIDGRKVLTYVTDNRGRWSGDHCCDPVHVPGVLFVNRRVTRPDPALTDIAPTILQEFGVRPAPEMIGAPVVAAPRGG